MELSRNFLPPLYYELSKICSMLTMIKLSCTHEFIQEYPTIVNKFIGDLKCYFTKLTHVCIRMRIGSISHVHILDNYKAHLFDEIVQQEDKYYYTVEYSVRNRPGMSDYLHI